jgi:hypothetical protein
MVDYRSEPSRSRTGIHGGVRRGTAAAAVGAVLVLSAGVPASQAADGSPDSGEPDIQVTATAQLPVVGGLLQGLLGSGTQPASPQPTSTATSSPTGTVSPSPVPASPVAPAPSTVSQPPATGSAPATSSAPASQAVPGPTGVTPGAASGAAALPQGAGSGFQAGAGNSAGRTPADQQGPAAPEAGETGQPTSGTATPTAGSTSRSGSLQAAGTPAVSRQGMAPAPQPAMEAAKVWLGVGLLGSAGAAGLVFARIRRS